MKAIAILLLLFVLLVPFGAAASALTSRPACTAANVHEWLTVRKGHLNAALDVAGAATDEKLTPLQASVLMHELAASLWAVPRPECADEAMLWTQFVFSSFAEIYACIEGNWKCYEVALARAQTYKDIGVPTVLVPLEAMAKYDPRDPALTAERPEGWDIDLLTKALNPPPAPSVNPTWRRA